MPIKTGPFAPKLIWVTHKQWTGDPTGAEGFGHRLQTLLEGLWGLSSGFWGFWKILGWFG